MCSVPLRPLPSDAFLYAQTAKQEVTSAFDFSQGYFILRPLHAYGAHKWDILAVFAGKACKNRQNILKLACEAGQKGGEMEN